MAPEISLLRFKLDDNNDAVANYLSLYRSGTQGKQKTSQRLSISRWFFQETFGIFNLNERHSVKGR